MKNPPFQKLLRYWKQTESEMVFDAHQEKPVASIEGKYGISFPPDFRDYLVHACPIDGAGDVYVTWWPVKNIKNFPDECDYKLKDPEIAKDAKQYVFFADHLVWSWAWAICCKPGENYGRIVVMYSPETFVFDSFEQFVDAYILGWEYVC